MPADLLADATALAGDIAELRHAIHREPELGLELPRTQAKVLGALDGLPLGISCGRGPSGPVHPTGRRSTGPCPPAGTPCTPRCWPGRPGCCPPAARNCPAA